MRAKDCRLLSIKEVLLHTQQQTDPATLDAIIDSLGAISGNGPDVEPETRVKF
jgi:hypothetical protein